MKKIMILSDEEYIRGFCQFREDGIFIYDKGYRPLDDVLQKASLDEVEYIKKMIGYQMAACEDSVQMENLLRLESQLRPLA